MATTIEMKTKEEMLATMTELNKENMTNKEQKKQAVIFFKNSQKVGNKVFCDLPVDFLTVDREMYQRPLQRHVQKIAQEWNDAKCDPLMVNYRADGLFYCIDGQHRLEAARMRGIESLVCACFVGLTLKEEADIFTEQNEGTKKLTPFDTYKANLCRGERVDTIIHDICEKYGVRVAKGKQPRTLNNITMARYLVKHGGAERLEWVFDLFKSCGWDNMKGTYSKEILSAINCMYVSHKNNLDNCKNKLVEFFKKSTPDEVSALANVEYPNYAVSTRMNMFLEEVISGERTPEPPTKKTATITRIA